MAEENEFGFPMKDGYEAINNQPEEENNNNGEPVDPKPDENGEPENNGEGAPTENNVASNNGDLENNDPEDKEKNTDGEPEDPKPDTDGDPDPEVEPENPVVEPEKEDTSSLIREEISSATDGEFSSTEDMFEAYNNLKETVSGKTLMETLDSQVEDAYGEGVTFSDIVEYKSRNFDEMDRFKLISEYEQMKDPEISEKGLAAELRPYDLLGKSEAEIAEMIEDERITQDQYDDLDARLDRQSREAKNALKEFQDSINIDELSIPAPKSTEPVVPAETEEETKARLEYYDKAIGSLNGFKVEVGTKENPASLDLAASEEDRNGVREFLSEDESGQNFIDKRWKDEDGIIKMEQLSEDSYKIINYERDIQIAYTQGKSAGAGKEVKDINNIDFNKGDGAAPNNDQGLSQAAKIALEANS